MVVLRVALKLFWLVHSIGVSTYNIPSAFLAMVVLPADPFFYVWNATVMSLDIDNVIVFFKASFFCFLQLIPQSAWSFFLDVMWHRSEQ